MPHPLLADTPAAVHLLLGNEAIVRGALEAGVGFISCYPGTPSSEVPDTFFRLSPDADYYFEYSVNEKVALEVGGGATLAGVRTLVTMKHVGVNVAADPLMSLAYSGTPGGLVLLNADDPGCHSSQNEQDNRYYFRLAGLPCLEPATAQEAKDMTRDAFALSVKWQQPVVVRTTTRLNHLRGPVSFGSLEPPKTRGAMERDPQRFVLVPAHARIRHKKMLENLEAMAEEAENSPWNNVYGKGELGVLASGITRAYLRDILEDHDLQDRLTIFELGFSYPLPEQKLTDFLKGLRKVLILEELEPVLEREIRDLIARQGLSVEVVGKGGELARTGEYSPEVLERFILRNADLPVEETTSCEPEQGLPVRPPNLCAGCPHRATYFAVRRIFGDEAVYSGDIGCYTLGVLPPLKMADYLFCMGSSISAGSGTARVTEEPVIAFIGDSTFFHSGITGLVNAVANRHDLLVVILDNRTTAMTGHQPHPGVEQTMLGPNPSPVDIEGVIKGCGVEHVRKVKPLNLKATEKALREFRELPGVRVLIAEDPCPLFARRALGKKQKLVAVISDSCDNRRVCLEQLACPAFYDDNGKVRINPDRCSGCMLCLQVCPNIKSAKRS